MWVKITPKMQSWRVVLILSVFSLFLKPLFAQVPELEKWDKTFGGGGVDKLFSMIATPDGGYLLGGYTTSGSGGDLNVGNKGIWSYWVVKTNADGSKAWEKTFSGGGFDHLTALVATSDGGYLLGGSSSAGANVDKTESARGNDDFWILKLDGNGNKLWDKTFGGAYKDELTAMIQTADGGYLIGGNSDSPTSGDKTATSRRQDYWVVKITAEGTKVWDGTYGGNGGETLTSLATTTDGGYVLGGHSNSWVSGDKSEEGKGYGDYWIIKLKTDGTKEWDKTIGGNFADILYALTILPDGGILVGGSSESDISGDKTEANKSHHFDGIGSDYWIVKLSASGDKIWDKTVGGNYEDRLSAITLTKDGGYLIGGWSSSGASGDKTDISRGGYDYWMAKLNANGSKVWDKALGGSKADYLQAMIVTTDGFLLGGYSNSSVSGEKTENSKGYEDFWIVKIKEKGTVLETLVPITKVWDKQYGGIRSDQLSAMVATTNGGYLLAGSSESYSTYSFSQYWIVKVNADGSKEWDKFFLGTDHGVLSSIINTPDGGYLLGGHSKASISDDKTAAFKGGYDYWIIKLHADGSKDWDKTYGGDSDDYFSTVIPTLDGGYLLGGSSWSRISEDKSEAARGSEDYWVVKIDAAGEKIWDKTIGGNNTDILTSLVASPDGSYLLGGYSNSGASGDKKTTSLGYDDYWIVKLNANGSKAWDKTLGGSGNDRVAAMLPMADGSYLLGGNSDSDASFYKTTSKKGYSDYWIVKLSAEGFTIWDKTYGGHYGDILSCMTPTADGGFLLGGSSGSQGDADKTEATKHPDASNYWIIKIKPDGSKEWDKTIGGNNSDQMTTVLETVDGSFLVGGYSNSGAFGDKTENSLSWQDDYWVVKFKLNQALATKPPVLNNISAKQFCVSPTTPGTPFQVSYTSVGSFTGTWHVQLSNKDGVFPVNVTSNLIGRGNGTSPITATIPAGTPTGTNYRVRVVNTSPAIAGEASISPITVSQAPGHNQVDTIPITEQTISRNGTGTIVSASASTPSTYQWLYGTSPTGPYPTEIAGATSPSFQPTGTGIPNAGIYYLVARATSNCGNVVGYSSPVKVTIQPESLTLATEPTSASTTAISQVTYTSMRLSFIGGNGTKRLVLAKLGSPVDVQPKDAIAYTANATFRQGQEIGNGNFTVFNGSEREVVITGLRSNTTYYFAVFEYKDNNQSGTENYLTTAISRVNQMTPALESKLLLEENFTYKVGSALVENSWVAYQGLHSDSIRIMPEGLIYPEYGANQGPATSLKANEQSVSRQFEPVPSGAPVYAAFLVNVKSANSSGEYFFHLGPQTLSATYCPRISVRSSAHGIQFGISSSNKNTAAVFTTEEYSLHTTYLIAIRFEFNESGNTSVLYVNPPLSAEPNSAQAVSTEVGSIPLSNIGSIGLRQSSNFPELAVDGLRVGTSYEAVMARGTLTGTKNELLNAAVSIYPNPANDFLFVQVEKAGVGTSTVYLYDIYGRTAFRKEVKNKNGKLELRQEVTSFGRGYYQILINTPKGAIKRHIVLQ